MSLILSGTDGLSDVDGTAATPAIRGTDANTGIFFPAADTIAFAEGGAECARFDSSGNFGLGVAPSAWGTLKAVQVKNTAWSSDGNVATLTGNSYYDGSNFRYIANGASCYYQINNSGGFNWNIAASGTAGNVPSFTQAMTLDASGNLLVGTTTTDYKFRVNGTSHFGDGYDNGVYGQVEITRPANQGTQFHLSFVRQGTQISGMGFLNNSSTFAIQNASTNAGSGVTLAVNGTSWGTTSDERTKDILGGVDNALQKLSNWRTVYFKYKTDAEAQTQRVGLIAQDVQATLPEAVSIEEDEIKTLQLRYTEVIPVLVKAIQEQQALITTLTARISALESA